MTDSQREAGMKRYLIFIHTDGPIIGAIEVPPCFEILPALQSAAMAGGILVGIKELPEGELERLVLAQGRALLNTLKTLIADPSFN